LARRPSFMTIAPACEATRAARVKSAKRKRLGDGLQRGGELSLLAMPSSDDSHEATALSPTSSDAPF
jgi:hypothetical protein